MISQLKSLFGKQQKSVPVITVIEEVTREGQIKSFIPQYLYRPPYGIPRYVNIPYIRHLARTPYVDMCISTIIAEIASLEWDIVLNPNIKDDSIKVDDAEVDHIRMFFENPNTNKESFEDVFIKMPIRDLLEINSGVLNKVFNLKKEMVEIVARDASTFTKNPDMYGMITHREDIILGKNITTEQISAFAPFHNIGEFSVKDKAAYFQYGWTVAHSPIPFGKRELVWMQNQLRTDDMYGNSPVQILAKNLQTMIYQIETDLEYYNNNNVPKGVLGIDTESGEEIQAFKEQWNAKQTKRDEFGLSKKIIHTIPILGKIPKFERIEFSSDELQLIEKQKWYSKLVWACFGVTGTELGFTEDAKGMSNQIVQSKVFRKKAINPMLRLLENRYNGDIVSEFEYTVSKSLAGREVQIPKYVFKFKTFDIDEARAKAELHEILIKIGRKTVNEIRLEEGDKEVEWGDEPPKHFMNSDSSVNVNFSDRERQAQDTNKDTEKEPDVRQNRTTEKEKDNPGFHPKKDKKADNPLVPKQGEKLTGETKLESAFNFVLRQNEKKLLALITEEMKPNILADLKAKSLRDIIDRIKTFLTFGGLDTVVGAVIKANFGKGWEDAEKILNQNLIPNNRSIDFLSKHTFANVKDMTTELEADLRQILERGFIQGKGSKEITAEIKKAFDSTEARAAAIARTETNRAKNFGKLHAFQESGRPAKKYLRMTQGNNHQITLAMNRKYGTKAQAIPLNENFSAGGVSGQAPPFHPNERDELVVLLI